MRRDVAVLLQDISSAAKRVLEYTAGMDRQSFCEDAKTVDAVLRNLTVIGEAVKRLSPDFRATHGEVDWHRIAGFRDIVVHDYAAVDLEIVWDVVSAKIPALAAALGRFGNTAG